MNIRMSCLSKGVLLGFLGLIFGLPTFAQTPVIVPTSVDAGLVIDAAGPEQRKSLNAIYLIACPNVGFGSGFLLDTGIVVTNVYVVATCTEQTLVGISTANKQVKFSRVIKDAGRDLALLVPTEKLTNGLKVAVTDSPVPGTTVSTWGYPFGYNGISPLLSVGYVSGYREDISSGKAVKHIVVNGAFNHGNSGGPLLIAHDNEVIGVVVLTFNFYPAEVKQIIDALMKQGSGFMVGTETRPDGSKQPLSEAQVTAMVLNEFYEKTQVMIGEAVAGSELAAMVKEHSSELPTANSEPKNTSNKAPVQKRTQ
jgi:S1-C subfamily serine protease